jgi:hypothetical protein
MSFNVVKDIDSNSVVCPYSCTQPPMGTRPVLYGLYAVYCFNKNLAKAVRTTVNEVKTIAS